MDNAPITMLWFDNDPKTTFEEKLTRAAAYYTKKYGTAPDHCLVHSSVLETTDIKEYAGIKIETKRHVLKHHLHLTSTGTNSDDLRENKLLDTK